MSIFITHLGSSSEGKWESHAPYNMAAILGLGSTPTKPVSDSQGVAKEDAAYRAT